MQPGGYLRIISLLSTCRTGSWLADFRRDHAGGVAIMFGLTAPILFGLAAVAVDFGLFTRDRVELQNLTDAAALAAARAMQMARADQVRIQAVAKAYIHSRQPGVVIQTTVDPSKNTVAVASEKTFTPFMGQLVWQGTPIIKVNATAKLSGTLPLCLLALEPKRHAAIHLERNSQITAPGCMIYSNSKHPAGLQAKDNAVVTAGLICSAGGKVKVAGAKFTPEPQVDCPPMADPLRARTPPASDTCNYNITVISGGRRTLQPGVYCKGLWITNGADVSLAPGLYVIKDGPLVISDGGIFRGTDVALYLKGYFSNLTFASDSTISLSAPKDGPLAGILIFDDPSGTPALSYPPYALPLPLVGSVVEALRPPREHKILSDNARTLLGTIYMPEARLIIDATKPIADRSAYTVLVVRQLDLHDGPNLILNSDYSATEVPVPKGLGPYGSNVSLTN
jgi:Flp pilus assembly protein TadG